MFHFIYYRMQKFDPHQFKDYMSKYFVRKHRRHLLGCPRTDGEGWNLLPRLQNLESRILVSTYKFNLIRLFPIVTPNKLLFSQFLLESGINAYRGATQLAYVKPSQGYKDAENSKWLMENIIYMPIHWGMSDGELQETVERTIECYHRLLAYLKQEDMPKPRIKKTVDLLERPRL